MSSLQYIERATLEKILGMRTGYVSDFSDKSLKEFVLETTGIDIFTEKYEESGTSKANRIRSFWRKESDEITVKLIEALLNYAEMEKTSLDRELPTRDELLFLEARKIVQRMKDEAESNPSDKSSTFVKIAPGAKLSGLKMRGNMMVGNGSLLENHGELENAELIHNKQISHPKHNPFTVHGDYIVGDKITGDKVGRDKNVDSSQNVLESTRDIPLWLKWVGAIVAILGFGWGVYIYFNPNWQTVPVVSSANTIPNRSDFSTTTPNLAVIFLKTNSMLDLEKENILGNYQNGPVYAVGAVFDNINSSGEGFIVRMTVERNAVGCAFGPEFKKELLLLKKGDKIDFYGIFTGGGLGGYGAVNPWYITDCVLLK